MNLRPKIEFSIENVLRLRIEVQFIIVLVVLFVMLHKAP